MIDGRWGAVRVFVWGGHFRGRHKGTLVLWWSEVDQDRSSCTCGDLDVARPFGLGGFWCALGAENVNFGHVVLFWNEGDVSRKLHVECVFGGAVVAKSAGKAARCV